MAAVVLLEVLVSSWTQIGQAGFRRFHLQLRVVQFLFEGGLLSSRMTVSGATSVPGRMMIRSTRPLVVAGIHRRSSGTRVPEPRTCRIMEPR
jgi:hypothetical protein